MGTREVAALRRAVEKLGGQAALARACGVKQGHVWHWLNKSGRVPGNHVLAIEAATDGAVTRYDLRPDIFCEPVTTAPEKDPVRKDLPTLASKAATSKDMLNGHILAQIIAVEARQHRALREAVLGHSGARDYLANLDAEIATLRSKLHI